MALLPTPLHARPVRQGGVTLVELVTMLLVLAVLAAVALPRYADVQGRAREARVKSAASAMQAVAALVRGNAEARGLDCDDPRPAQIQLDGAPLALTHCYPQALPTFADGILAAARVAPDGLSAALRREGARPLLVVEASDALTPAHCAASYTPPARGADGAVIGIETRGC